MHNYDLCKSMKMRNGIEINTLNSNEIDDEYSDTGKIDILLVMFT